MTRLKAHNCALVVMCKNNWLILQVLVCSRKDFKNKKEHFSPNILERGSINEKRKGRMWYLHTFKLTSNK